MSAVVREERIGDAVLYLADSSVLMPTLGVCARAMVTDPPYKMEIHGRGFASKREYYSALDYGTHTKFEISSDWLNIALACLLEKSAFFFCNKHMLRDLLNTAVSADMTFDILAFCKSAPAPLTNNQWLPDKEFGIHMFSSLPVRGDYTTKRTWSVSANFKNPNTSHPSAKPVELLLPIILNISDEGDTIIDPFMGSASTGLAALRTGRKFIGIERHPTYFEESVRRIKAHYHAGPLFAEFAA